ncbi:hypothetical protein [Pseudobdellovibrio exovorus]|uniref:Uncharacterized protein n=1 Tax=Pseudobdellovibrio exovorus JSS TaxID=1184267 RepID=M4VDU3_9BACT|nr:hypothetical protein [Pseudobdellovibrio exovorus]AGH96211.1 hypothetical protein A11Q_1995 [Pseudobdellovibrio exovorus JSS]
MTNVYFNFLDIGRLILIKLFFISFSLISYAQATAAKKEYNTIILKEKERNALEELFKKLSISSKKMKIVEVSGGDYNNDPRNYTDVEIGVRNTEPIVFMGNKVSENTIFSVVDGKIRGFDLKNDETFKIGKWSCVEFIEFDPQGNLCFCRINQSVKVRGYAIPTPASIYLKSGRLSHFASNYMAPKLSSGYYKIDAKGKPISAEEMDGVDYCQR